MKKLSQWKDPDFWFGNNTLILLIFLGLGCFFVYSILPFVGVIVPDKWYIGINSFWVVTISIAIFSMTRDIKVIKSKVENNYTYRSFKSGDQFDKYLAKRFKKAKSVRVIHFSSNSFNERQKYYRILTKFISKEGNSFERIIAKSENKEALKWHVSELIKHEQNSFHIYVAEDITLGENMKTMGVMIIDDEEICFGGGYRNEHKTGTVSIFNPDLVAFYANYFAFLAKYAVKTRHENNELDIESLTMLGIDFIAIKAEIAAQETGVQSASSAKKEIGSLNVEQSPPSNL